MTRKGLLLTAATILAMGGTAMADTAQKRIALSNNYAGNSWRQAMLESWKRVTDKAVADGIVAAADAFTTAENQATEQAAQIQNMILQGYDAIVVNAASPTALNGAIKEACDAGIEEGVKAHPNFKVVGSVNGDWAQDVAQKAVAGILPSLPEIAAVVTQGGDGYGAAQAFAAAGRPMPIIIMGNRQDELKWWAEQRDANGYETISTSIAPGVSTLAFWVAQQILDGAEVPKDLTVPFLSVTQDTLDQALKDTPEGGVTNVDYTLDDAKKVIAGTN